MRFSSVLLLSTALFLLSASDNHHNRRGSNVVDAQVSVFGRFGSNYAGSLYHDLPISDLLESYQSDSIYTDFVESSKLQGSPPCLHLPHLDNAQLLNQEEQARARIAEQGQFPDSAYQFGKAISIESSDTYSTLSRGRWIPLRTLLQQREDHSRQYQRRQQHATSEDDDEIFVWQLEISSKSALSLNLIFSEFRLPKDTEFYVSGKKHILGAFTAEINNKPDGVFATAPVAGDKLLLEYYTPIHLLQEGMMPQIQLSHVIHGYKPTLLASSSDLTSKGFRQEDGSIRPRHRTTKSMMSNGGGFKDQSPVADVFESWALLSNDDADEMPPVRAMSGKCNVDVACHQQDYYDQSRSVGVILTDYNQKYCTGAMVNNARQDGRQLFLTANHCAGFSDTSAHVVMFNHEKLQCGGGSEVVNEHDTAMGLVKLGHYAPSDYTLYEITEPIPDAYNLYLAGWSALNDAPASRPRNRPHKPSSLPSWRTPRSTIKNESRRGRNRGEDPILPAPEEPSTSQTPIVGIHHPSGDSKKISFFYNGTLPKACWSECEPEEYFHWQIPRWDQGTTEPGSSGSPLFDADKRIVGQLHGGSASCWNKNGYDIYGAIYASFQTPPKIKNRLATYLDPEGTGTKVMDGYNLEIARRDWQKHHKQEDQERGQYDNREGDDEEDEDEESETERRQFRGQAQMGDALLEKPLKMFREEQQEILKDTIRHPRDQFERMSHAFDKVWGRLAKSCKDLQG
ncbi:hypothetical protein EDD11_008771 [Mortierella claussenii]|nr:hypothetical protein EDD11_008771 [Mortierella claussenii]